MLWEERRYLMSARAEAKNYIRSMKEYKTKEEKRAFKLAYELRIKDMKNKASKLEDHERKLTERAIRSLCRRVGFINIFNA